MELTAERRRQINNDEDFKRIFLSVLMENRSLMDRLIETGDFEANRHSCHDGCPNSTAIDGEEKGTCEDCYSFDTENEMQGRTGDLLAKIWSLAFDLWKQDRGHGFASEGSGEDSEEAIEMDDSDELREEQDDDGNYITKLPVAL